MKKSHSKLSKNQPVCMSMRLVCWIRAGGGGGSLREAGELSETP